MAIGLGIGVVLALLRLSKNRPVSWSVALYIEVFRNTPTLVQIIWFYYVLPIVTGILFSSYVAGLLALTLNVSAYLAEIVRAGIQSVPKSQSQAGQALGMSYVLLMRRIILPQAFRNTIPPIISQLATQMKLTALVAFIAVGDLMYRSTQIVAVTFRPLEIYTAIAIIYFLLVFPLSIAGRRLERYVRREG